MKVIMSMMVGGLVASAGMGSAQTTAEARAAAEQRQSRYQIGVMERVLEGAVEHGASEMRSRWQTVMQTEMLILDNARVRGFRLEGYGVFFDVIVPSVEGTLAWSFRVLDQNDLGLNSALQAIKAYVAAAGNADLEQALKRIELQVDPTILARAASPSAGSGARNAVGSAASTGADKAPADPILSDPLETFRTEVKQALMDAMLDHSSSLGIGPAEWLTVAARRNEDRPQLAPADSDARTVFIRVRGSDLLAFLARQISREEALKRMEVRVF
ncbi:MAG: hypothetical protein A3G76_00340 [Acidobacteria bacterium RIFCSPLOWO2_12_FULL_65_11]|nr:MAG: hypothetical protein A3H95_15685 [Acidobacteria bacterium RIFCSPLOWO2_02_FULL_64_15]OFW32886.1 MAG: hypothetical protein A3G76_00340 [Acidobacteria bacterium RIFCSPLOWO2_12_FULL_65_11]